MPNFSKEFSSKSRVRYAELPTRLALLLMILLPGVLAFAQAAGPAGFVRQAPRRQTRRSMDDRVRVLAKALDLSEAQRSAVKTVLEQRQQEAWRIRRDPSIPGIARIDMFRALQDTTVEQIRAVLNEEQRRKYDPLGARKIQPAPQQKSVQDWLEATTQH